MRPAKGSFALRERRLAEARAASTDRTDTVRLYKYKILDWSIWVWSMYIPTYTHQIIEHFDVRINMRGGKPIWALLVTVRPRQYPDERVWQYVLEGALNV